MGGKFLDHRPRPAVRTEDVATVLLRYPGNLAYSPELWEWMFDLGL
ncbi:hypothetical protein [Streptomyces sp. NPDC046862]